MTPVSIKTMAFRDVTSCCVADGTYIHTYIHNVLTTSYHGRTFILLVILQHRIPLGRSDTSEFGLRVDVSETLSLVSSGPKWGFSINCHYQQSACPVFAVVLALLFTAKTSKF